MVRCGWIVRFSSYVARPSGVVVTIPSTMGNGNVAIILNMVSQSPSIASSSSSCVVLSKPKRCRMLHMVVLFGGRAEQHRENERNVCLPFAEFSLFSISFPYVQLVYYSSFNSVSMRPSYSNNSIFYNISVCIAWNNHVFSVFLWRLFPVSPRKSISLFGSCQTERLDESCTRGGKTCGRFPQCGISL